VKITVNMKTFPTILAYAFLVSTAPASSIVFTDNTFDLTNYSVSSVFTSSGSDTVSSAQCPTCGNPGQALQILMTLPGSGDVAAVGFINNTFAYDPLSQGPIATIDASVDKNIITNIPVDPSNSLGNTFRPLIEQDGLFYLATIAGPAFTGGSTGYNTISQIGLLATDFLQFDFATGTFGTAHPNFAGDPMVFGLAQRTEFFVTDLNFEADYDNLNLSLSVRGVPDGGSTVLLLLGSVGALLVLQRMLPRQQACP
jgi:hypothetical protein